MYVGHLEGAIAPCPSLATPMASPLWKKWGTALPASSPHYTPMIIALHAELNKTVLTPDSCQRTDSILIACIDFAINKITYN